ncbi:hypothetical protein MKW92_045239 [Papaver armeniacum]|nr:hypothetical protein MKW92_045239 [Papaver armeniacum]
MDLNRTCVCGNEEFEESNGFYYCTECGQKVEGMCDTAMGDETYNGTYSQFSRRPAAVVERETQESEFWRQLRQPDKPKNDDEEMKPYVPADSGSVGISEEDYANELRMTYTMGIQLMIESQCEALVEQFGVSPLICGLAGALWLRFVAASKVFDENWASQICEDSEMQIEGEVKVRKPRSQFKNEPLNLAGERLLIIWLRSLRNKIPLSFSLSISYLACHIAREPIVPTDVVKWAHDGKLPFLNAFVRIGEIFGEPSAKCPLTTDKMFRPLELVGWRNLESQAGYIAECIGLELPPVNFDALARRYLNQLKLRPGKILEVASMIHHWSMPPDLWLSSSIDSTASHLCVMSIIMVAIRVLYTINGFGEWENQTPPESSGKRKLRKEKKKKIFLSSLDCNTFDAAKLLTSLEVRYEEIQEEQITSVSLLSYLKYCREVVFGPVSDTRQAIIVENLWSPYIEQEDFKQPEKVSSTKCSNVFEKGSTSNSAAGEPMLIRDGVSPGSIKNRSLNRLISNMKENEFYYTPPRGDNAKTYKYLYYAPKNTSGPRIFAVHADYYILLRVCALVAEADVQDMHQAVLMFEKRLAWIDGNIDKILKSLGDNV